MKTLITCINFKQELEKATNNAYQYFYHYPLCIDNKLNKRDLIQEIIDQNNLTDYHAFCCEICKKSHSNKKTLMTSTPLCFYQVLNKSLVDYYIEQRYYLVTPGWLENWRKYVVEEWQFSEESAQMFFNDSFKRILVLDTGVSKSLKENIDNFSSYIGKEYDILPVGFDYYNQYIQSALLSDKEFISIEEYRKTQESLININMGIELIKNLNSFTDETTIINSITNIIQMMFMPKFVCYVPINHSVLEKKYCIDYFNEVNNLITSKDEQVVWLKSGKGFATKILFGDQLLGIIVVDEIHFFEYKEKYYNTFVSITNVIALAINSSRLYKEIMGVSNEYQRQKSYFEQLFKNSPDMIVITDIDYVIGEVNLSFKQYFKNSDSFIHKPLQMFLDYYSQDDKDYVLHSEDHQDWVIELIIGGNIKYIDFIKYPIVVQNQIDGYYVVLKDITKRAMAQRKIQDKAYTDSLTGLYNRAYCDEQLSKLSTNVESTVGFKRHKNLMYS